MAKVETSGYCQQAKQCATTCLSGNSGAIITTRKVPSQTIFNLPLLHVLIMEEASLLKINSKVSKYKISYAYFFFSGAGDSICWPVRPSLFPNIPPYIRFSSHDAETEVQMQNGKKFFKWKLSTITPLIVRKTLTNSGFALVRSEFSRGVHPPDIFPTSFSSPCQFSQQNIQGDP